MKRRLIGVAVVVAIILGGGLVATQSFAHNRGGPGPRMHGHRGFGGAFNRLFKALDLTDEQKQQARDIMVAARKEGIQIYADLKLARLNLHEQLMQDEVDQAVVEQHLDRVGQVHQQHLRHRVATRLKLRELLTHEQRDKARTLFMDHLMDDPRHGFHGRGAHGRGEGRDHQ